MIGLEGLFVVGRADLVGEEEAAGFAVTAFGVMLKMTANAWIRRSSSSLNLTETISCSLASLRSAAGGEPRLGAGRGGLMVTGRLSPWDLPGVTASE